MIPILAKKDDLYYPIDLSTPVDLPSCAIIVGSNGVFFQSDSNAYDVIAEKKDANILDEIKEKATFNYPIIGYEIFKQSLEFLRQVYKKHKAEGIILLTLNRDEPLADQKYGMIIPEQEVASASADYQVPELPEGIFLAGSIHSHPSFGAYQSSTDEKDEFTFDGVHLTFGHIDKKLEIHERVCMSGSSFEYEKALIETSPPEEEDIDIPDEWMGLVTKKTYTTIYSGMGRGHWEQTSPGVHNWKQDPKNKSPKKVRYFEKSVTVRDLWLSMKPDAPTNQKNSPTLIEAI